MNPLPCNPDLAAVAARVVWFDPPAQALAEPVRFLAYLMTYGTPEEIAVVRHYVSEDEWREALDRAPPGIFDARSWAYWNLMADRDPPRPMPKRIIPGSP